MISLPPCVHRGVLIGRRHCQCNSTLLIHHKPGVATLSTCLRPCPFANVPGPELHPGRGIDPMSGEDYPCQHRSLEQARVGECDLCGHEKGQPFAVFSCSHPEIGGECSPHKVHSKVRPCGTCEFRQLPLTRVDTGRADLLHVSQPYVQR